MAIIESTTYNPPVWFRNGHIQSIFPTLCRKVDWSYTRRERITTPDDDFLDVDWHEQDSKRLIMISHGLEGSSQRPYVTGMARIFALNGWDVLAWNFRSCSGEMNRQLRFYHNGTSDDLDTVVRHALDTHPYESIFLTGFSMGGNLTLVYLGEYCDRLPQSLKGAVVFSVPCDLTDSSVELAKFKNKIYMVRFMKYLRRKILEKAKLYPEQIDISGLKKVTSFKQFDDRFTAPLHGFKDAHDYWQKCSSLVFIDRINVPTLIVNAADDPFLAGKCYPMTQLKNNPLVDLEIPRHGGHVGFVSDDSYYWSEKRALRFAAEIIDRINNL